MYNEVRSESIFTYWQAILMKKTTKRYSDTFIRFLHAFGLKWVAEYESLSAEEKKICDRAYLKDLPNLIKKSN